MRKQDYLPPIFADGPCVGSPEYAAWIAAQTTVKLPFTIWREPTLRERAPRREVDRGSEVAQQRLGAVGVHAAPPDELVRFSDAALGIPLDDRLRVLCTDEPPCRVWLAGKFRESTVFDVHAVHARVEGEGPHHAQSVRGPDCLAIRTLKHGHCARGPTRCEKCRAAERAPATPMLLDVCPYGDYARPTIEIARGPDKTWRPYDVLRTFASDAEARDFASKYQITDVALGD